MNWQYLRYFEVVACEEHFTRAAEKLHITQSALSKSIANLEEEIGIPLFEHHGRNVKLTRYGSIFYNHVSAATKEIESAISTIRTMTGVNSGEVHLASIFSLGGDFLPKTIQKFQKENSSIRLKFYQKSTKDIVEDVLNGTADLGFCGEFPRDGSYKEIACEIIQVEELLLAVSMNHRWANRDSIEFSEILDANENFIGYTQNTGIIHSINETLSRAGYDSVQFNEQYQAGEDNTVAGMIRAGMGVGFLADSKYIQREGLSFLHVKNPYFSRKLYLIWKKDGYLSQAAKTFKYHVLSQVNI